MLNIAVFMRTVPAAWNRGILFAVGARSKNVALYAVLVKKILVLHVGSRLVMVNNALTSK